MISSPDSFITIFTAPKPFINPHTSLIQRNAILSWQQMGEEVCIFIVGDEPGMQEFAGEAGLFHLNQVICNPFGTPLVNSVFACARQMSTSPLLAYVNADIVLTPQFIEVARQVYSQLDKFLIAGQRYDLNLQQALEFFPGWDLYLLSDVQTHGRLHPANSSDYFIFPRACFTDLPKFSIGRAGWANWMLFHARSKRYPVIDASSRIFAIHQDHDYNHLPSGQPHYRLPESTENIRLAGGPRAMFTLADANFTIHDGQLTRIPLSLKKFIREIEIFPLIRLQSPPTANFIFSILHPIKAWKEWRMRAKRKNNRDYILHD